MMSSARASLRAQHHCGSDARAEFADTFSLSLAVHADTSWRIGTKFGMGVNEVPRKVFRP